MAIKRYAKRMVDVRFQEGTPTRYFTVSIEVFYNDGGIEVMRFKDWLKQICSQLFMDFNFKSCEMMADDLYDQIASTYPNRDVIINIRDDEDNGVTINYLK